MKDKTYIKDLEDVIEQKDTYIQELEDSLKLLEEVISKYKKNEVDRIIQELKESLSIDLSNFVGETNSISARDEVKKVIDIDAEFYAKAFHIDVSEELKQVHEHQNHLKQLQEEYGTDSKNNI